jgi:hypothetical protein
VVETEGQAHALVEISLGLGVRGRDRDVQGAEVLIQRRRAFAGWPGKLAAGRERLGLGLGQHQLV